MSSIFYPIIFNYIFQSLVATESSQSSLSSQLLYVTANDIIHAVFLKCSILRFN